ncbi:PREDICTED: probable polygalacturonase At3g15720 isoform X2 [Lupinus angustifolius]|uniref:probable polygalacturonase At3g15720 isoform X2 n=1 Tax=Lupinus angustifolius TaxID=3871 RepID=UPI00092EC42A|nr:PREDICTED: probable polygalacturonase At3g15720 isoform X2 [Lupinus angustifolius]
MWPAPPRTAPIFHPSKIQPFAHKILLIIGLLICSTITCNLWVGNGESSFDVLAYGAKGDDQSDDTQAFMKAWKALCGATQKDTIPKLVVPAGYTFFVRQIRFKGPCQSNQVHIQILGNLHAPERNEWRVCSRRWLHFLGISSMTIDGSGVINGEGKAWWKNLTQGCTGIPTALLFERCDGLQISGLTHINGPGSHIFVVHSKDVTISHVNIKSPEHSLNTDGIDISNSVRVNIHDSIIATGDDCIAIKGGTQFLKVSQVICGPGHGISVGSLGENGQNEFAEDIHVWNCTFNGASYGARIKTWPGGKGHVRAITFNNIKVNRTNYSLYIDQHYMLTPEKMH